MKLNQLKSLKYPLFIRLSISFSRVCGITVVKQSFHHCIRSKPFCNSTKRFFVDRAFPTLLFRLPDRYTRVSFYYQNSAQPYSATNEPENPFAFICAYFGIIDDISPVFQNSLCRIADWKLMVITILRVVKANHSIFEIDIAGRSSLFLCQGLSPAQCCCFFLHGSCQNGQQQIITTQAIKTSLIV